MAHRDAMLEREHLRKFGRDWRARPARDTFRLSAGTYAEHLEALGVALVGIDAGGEISLV